MSDTVKIRYIGPQTEGLWTAAGEHPAFDFEHGEYADVPVALAVELLDRREPVPPGDPVQDPETGEWSTKLAPVWELADGDASKLPAPPEEPEDKDAAPIKAPAAKKVGGKG